MGQEIVYCNVCGTRLTGADFEKGRAVRVGLRVLCTDCLRPEEREALLPKPPPRKTSETRIPTIKPAVGMGSSSLMATARPRERRSPTALYVGLAVALAAIVLGALTLMKPNPTAPPPDAPVVRPSSSAKAPEDRPTAPVDKLEDPVLVEARAALAKARSAPNDLAAWEEAARKTALTPFFKEASAGLQALRERLAAQAPVPVPVPPPVPVPVSVPDADPPGWTAALPLALARDFGAAASLLDTHPDNGQFRRMKALIAEGLVALPKLPLGVPLRLGLRDGTVVEGPLVRAGALRGEIGTSFVEWADVGAASLFDVLRKGPADRRTLAYLCLLEGDRAGFERLRGSEPVPERWLKIEGAKPAAPPPREAEARNRFYAAEREFAKPETQAAAVAKYKSLADDFAETALVKGEAERIRLRADACRDYLFGAGALKAAGTFGMGPSPRSETAWISKADSDPDKTLENYVEADFVALPELPYRCWALIGGCCAEAFTFYRQATDATELNPKTRQPQPADPGSALAAQVKHPVSSLRRTHAAHLPRIPKSPQRWEWVGIPLPKYAAGGPKKLRLISDQQGFAVGAIVVSATRREPPTDAELKKAFAVPLPPGLIGWWRLDGSLLDAAGGHPGKGAVKFGPGRIGDAIHFEGTEQVEIAGPLLLPQVTLSAWVKHDAIPQGVQRYVTVGSEDAVIRQAGERHIHFYVKLDGELKQMECQNALEIGKWTLVTGTWDGAQQKVYKDGVLLHTLPAAGRIAASSPNVLFSAAGEPLKGWLDDVRIYDRALSEDEVKRLYAETSAAVAVEPAGGKPWRAIFDGKSFEGIQHHDCWVVENGALMVIPGKDQAAQSMEAFGDGEIRVRFEATAADKFWFRVRQGGEGGYGVRIEDQDMGKYLGKPHEFVIAMKGDAVTATLDGKPHPTYVEGAPKRGRLQFNCGGRGIRILAIDFRE